MTRKYGLDSMPARGSKKAPSTFPTDEDDIKIFIKEFREVAHKHELDGREKCRAITKYMRSGARHRVKKTSAYREKDWSELKKKIKKILSDYDDDDEDRYRRKRRRN